MKCILPPHFNTDFLEILIGNADLGTGIGTQHPPGFFIMGHHFVFPVPRAPFRPLEDLIRRHQQLVSIHQTTAADAAALAIAGALLGLVLELLQLLLVSGVTQGASVLIRGAGLTAGAYVGRQICERGLLPAAQLTCRLGRRLFPVYLLSLLAISGWFARDVLGTAEALSRFDTVQLVPFYFHYFTTEPVAMAPSAAWQVVQESCFSLLSRSTKA